MILNNPTASPVYLDIYQPDGEPNATGSYIPAGATVDLAADGNATSEQIFNSIPQIRTAVETDNLLVVSVGAVLSKQDSLDNLAISYKAFLSPTITLEWTENGRLNDNSYLHNGVLEGGQHNGFILPYDCEPVEVGWSLNPDNKQDGQFVFKNNSDDQVTIGTVSIEDNHGHEIAITGSDFTPFICPKDKRIAVVWKGSRIDDVTLTVTFREV